MGCVGAVCRLWFKDLSRDDALRLLTRRHIISRLCLRAAIYGNSLANMLRMSSILLRHARGELLRWDDPRFGKSFSQDQRVFVDPIVSSSWNIADNLYGTNWTRTRVFDSPPYSPLLFAEISPGGIIIVFGNPPVRKTSLGVISRYAAKCYTQFRCGAGSFFD